MIDIKAARETYKDYIIDEIIWIRRNFNLAYAMKKTWINSELLKILTNGKLKIWRIKINNQDKKKTENRITEKRIFEMKDN